MNSIATNNWQEANQNYLMAALATIASALQARIEKSSEEQQRHFSISDFPADLSRPPALEQLCTTFGLSSFERDVLLLCAGMELDARFPSLCAAAQGDPQRAFVTFSLALATLNQPQWKALMPSSPLRRWRMLEIGAGSALTLSPLRIDERILHYLTGFQYLDERLAGIVEPWAKSGELVPSHQNLAEQLAATWSQADPTSILPIVQLCGTEAASKRAIASTACEIMGLKLNVINAVAIPLNFGELHQLIRTMEREYWLRASAVLLDCEQLDVSDTLRENAIAQLSQSLSSPLIISSQERRRSHLRPLITWDVHPPSTNEQRFVWCKALGTASSPLNGQVEKLVSHFNLSAPKIHAICTEAIGRQAHNFQLQGGHKDTAPIPNSSLPTPYSPLSTQHSALFSGTPAVPNPARA